VTTPKRWIDEQSDADDFERALLRSELDVAPPADMETDVLKRVMAVVAPVAPGIPGGPTVPVAPAAGGIAATGALAKSAATLGGLGKGFALGVGVSIAAATGNHFLASNSPASRPVPSSTVVLAVPSAAPMVAKPSHLVAPPLELPAADSPEQPASRTPLDSPSSGVAANPPTVQAPVTEPTPAAASVASFPSDGPALAASRLKEEAALLRRARAELRAGALAQAFATLEASRRSFTAPELTQEREALAIELLYRSGERTAAATRARDFLARFPESPHAAAVRAFSDDARR